MTPEVLLALLAIVGPILGLLLGASLQYHFTRRNELTKHYENLKTQAYVDFAKSAAGIALWQRTGNAEEEMKAKILMTDAKCRIAIYGSRQVVENLANFFRNHGALETPEAVAAFIVAIQAMREESAITKDKVTDKEIRQLVVGQD